MNNTLILMVLNLIGKLFSFFREMVFSYFYGTSAITDAFNTSTTAATLIFSVITYALSKTYIPSFSKISGGELQMLIIARALIKNPSLLILDEAESGLDFKNQLKIINLLKDLAKKRGITIVFNTHYPNYALKIADKVLILRENGDYFYGSRDIINEENIKKAFGVETLIRNIDTDQGKEKILIPYRLSENTN